MNMSKYQSIIDDCDDMHDEDDIVQRRFRSDRLFNETGRDGDGIEYEVKKISTAEEELLKKARDLENEMRMIRQAKLDVVVK